MGVWDVLAETDRVQWTYTPSVSVGPLRFEMSPDEVVSALEGFTGTVDSASPYTKDRRGEFRNIGIAAHRTAVTVYFGESEGLFCVVPDAQFGPQVTLDGVRLVGRIPSQLEAELDEYLSSRGIVGRYAPGGDLGAEELGILMSVQRAGDVVLTRPALLIPQERAYTLWDALPSGEGSIR